jgi:ribosome biogenesis protein BMS1
MPCRGVDRAPRKFNPLKIPKKLQAALPFKTKPKLEPPRKRKTLDQKRAVVLEPHERQAYTLLQQLNAIRCGRQCRCWGRCKCELVKQ